VRTEDVDGGEESGEWEEKGVFERLMFARRRGPEVSAEG